MSFLNVCTEVCKVLMKGIKYKYIETPQSWIGISDTVKVAMLSRIQSTDSVYQTTWQFL